MLYPNRSVIKPTSQQLFLTLFFFKTFQQILAVLHLCIVVLVLILQFSQKYKFTFTLFNF